MVQWMAAWAVVSLSLAVAACQSVVSPAPATQVDATTAATVATATQPSQAVTPTWTPQPAHTVTPLPSPAATWTARPGQTPTRTPTPLSTGTPTPAPTSPTARRLRMVYEIEHPTVLGQKTLVQELWLPLPNTDGDGTREFKLLAVYPDGYEILDIGEKNQAVYWKDVPDLCAHADCRFGVRFEIALERPMYTISWAKNPVYDTESELFRIYTRPQRGIESDSSRIRELAAQIVGSETNVYKQVLLIQAWVGQNVRYPQVGSTYPDDALQCIAQGIGDCSGQSKAFVALARAAGIPARTVAGLLPFKRGEGMLEQFGPRVAWFEQNLSVHVWVEVYLPPLGWVQGEPDMPGFGVDKERLVTMRGPFSFPNGLCAQATYFHLPLAVQGTWCGQSVGWEVSIDAEEIK